ncbi:hypothetical protein FOPPYZMZ_CDS0053 [Pseudomonas phage 9Ps-7B]|nr:hypothetical protein IPCDMZAV_CDS0376 [Pseudomonas phage 6B]WRQ05986.1 hypothetical protein QAMIJHJT_CDS0054 [Pseudomonas phage 9-Ps-8B]WRQ06394.1 hypothetical protein FOPPYZMZ_CDS0053 [Pseudomonas phage 9Ps-7B]WRQ07155.1 hypothetical protein ZBUARNPM_CDS0406 [Pseudomonas phage 14Ps5-6]
MPSKEFYSLGASWKGDWLRSIMTNVETRGRDYFYISLHTQ